MTRHEVGVGKYTRLLTEIADKARCDGIGGPFLVDDIAVLFDNEAKTLVASGEFFEPALGSVYSIQPFLNRAEAGSDVGDMRFKIRVDGDDWFGIKRLIAGRRARGCGGHDNSLRERKAEEGEEPRPSLTSGRKSVLMTLARPPLASLALASWTLGPSSIERDER